MSLIVLSSVIIVVSGGAGKTNDDEYIGKATRDPAQAKAEMESPEAYEKAHPAPAGETRSAEEQAAESEWWAKLMEEADKQIAYDIAFVEKGLEIVNRYSGSHYEETVTTPEVVDRDMPAAMADVVEKYPLTEDEQYTLKYCLANWGLMVLESDPLYERIEAILQPAS